MIRKKRFDDKVDQELKITHREKLEKFNKNLSQLPEHFDIPKVGPGWLVKYTQIYVLIVSWLVY